MALPLQSARQTYPKAVIRWMLCDQRIEELLRTLVRPPRQEGLRRLLAHIEEGLGPLEQGLDQTNGFVQLPVALVDLREQKDRVFVVGVEADHLLELGDAGVHLPRCAVKFC